MKYKLFYHISNNGDGSSSLHLHQTREEAEESSLPYGNIDILVDGELYYLDSDRTWKEMEKI